MSDQPRTKGQEIVQQWTTRFVTTDQLSLGSKDTLCQMIDQALAESTKPETVSREAIAETIDLWIDWDWELPNTMDQNNLVEAILALRVEVPIQQSESVKIEIESLRGALKSAKNKLEHLVPVYDPEKDEELNYFDMAHTVLARARGALKDIDEALQLPQPKPEKRIDIDSSEKRD